MLTSRPRHFLRQYARGITCSRSYLLCTRFWSAGRALVSSLLPQQNLTVSDAAILQQAWLPWKRWTSQHSKTNPSSLEMLSKEIQILSERIRQKPETFRKKQQLCNRISQALQEKFPLAEVYIIGSSANGFAHDNSDVDLCAIMSTDEFEAPEWSSSERINNINFLNKVAEILKSKEILENWEIRNSKVPLLRFVDKETGVDVEVNAEKYVGVRNTFLMRAYSEADPRLVPFVLVIKEWARIEGMIRPHRGLLSSYALLLLIIHYLQVCEPPLVPSLQCLHKDKMEILKGNFALEKLSALDPAQVFPAPPSKNTQNTAELLIGFFRYFSQFPFDQDGISIEQGGCIMVGNHSRGYVYVEEPLSKANVAYAVHLRGTFLRIRHEFLLAYEALRATASLRALGIHMTE